MALILSVETSTDICSVAIHDGGKLVGSQRYDLAKSHATLLATLIKELMINCDIKFSDLAALAVSAGPGSYTGLRIGVSTVKGIAFAHSIPIIGIDSLDIIYKAFQKYQLPDSYAMPMMDARRMEVYCQLRSSSGDYIIESKPLVIEENSLQQFTDMPISIFGNGAEKTMPLIGKKNITYIKDIVPEAMYMGQMAFDKFKLQEFEDTAYFEPAYLKEYKIIPQKRKLL